MSRRLMSVLAAAWLLAGCDLSMDQQPKHETQSADTLWQGGPTVQASPPGTVAIDAPERAAAEKPPEVTLALVERGQVQYGAFCTPCHGDRGAGDGLIVQRGFPRPESFHAPKLATMPSAHVVEAIARGYGVMYDFADKIEPADRWAIAAYVKALQRVETDRQASR